MGSSFIDINPREVILDPAMQGRDTNLIRDKNTRRAQELKQESQSKEILDKFRLKSDAYKNFKADFSYKMENKEANISESKDGKIIVEGNKYILEIAGQKVISDGKTVWTYIKEADEVQIDDVSEDEDAITPATILTHFDDSFRSKLVRSDFQYGSEAKIIDMIPIKGKSYYKIRLVINAKNYQIMDFSIFDKNGNTYSYVIRKFTPNIDLKDTLFIFNEKDYPDVEVIDLR